MPILSIVMPAYNEGEHIDESLREWHETVICRIPDSELLVVDDCSRDDTGTRLRQLVNTMPGLRALQTPSNAGHGRAVRFGLDECRGDFVFQTDSDRQHTPGDFWKLWERRHDAEFIFGVRERRADGRIRLMISFVLRCINALLWGHWIRDANCPYKLMRSRALHSVLELIPADSFIPMVFVSVLARRLRFRVIEIPVRHFARAAGEQSLKGRLKWLRVGSICLRQTLRLRLSVMNRRPKAAWAESANRSR